MAKFSCSHSLFPPSIFTTRFIFLIAIQSCQYQPNYHLHPVHLRPKDRYRKWRQAEDLPHQQCDQGQNPMWSPHQRPLKRKNKINSVTHQTFPLTPFVDDQGTHFLYKWKQENSRLPRAKVNGELLHFPTPSSRPHTYTVKVKKKS